MLLVAADECTIGNTFGAAHWGVDGDDAPLVRAWFEALTAAGYTLTPWEVERVAELDVAIAQEKEAWGEAEDEPEDEIAAIAEGE